jgi:hypothetical protein
VAQSPQTRDTGLRRVTRLTSWALAGAVALSASVSFLIAKAQTGSAASVGSSNTSGATTGAPAPVVIGPGTGGDGQLQPPISPPVRQSGSGGGVATSGGS